MRKAMVNSTVKRKGSVLCLDHLMMLTTGHSLTKSGVKQPLLKRLVQRRMHLFWSR